MLRSPRDRIGKAHGRPLRRVLRQVDLEERAATGRIRYIDCSAVQIDEILRDRQAEPGPFERPRRPALRLTEALEDRGAHLALDPGPTVLDGQPQAVGPTR